MSNAGHIRTRHCLLVSLLLLALFSAGRSGAEPYELKKLDQDYLQRAQRIDKDLDQRGYVYYDPEMEAYVNGILTRLTRNIELDPFIHLHVYLFRHPVENAFSLGNGSIYLSLGAITRVEEEDQLAAILAHEASHVILRHPFIGYKDEVQKATIANVAVIVTGMPAEDNLLFYLAVNGYSRKLEKEADLKAVELMAMAGYDPKGMIQTLELFDKDYDSDKQEEAPIFWRDHPTTLQRKDYLTEALKTWPLTSPPDPAMSDHKAYFNRTLALRHKTCFLDADMHRFGTAHAIAEQNLAQLPDDPASLVDMGMTERAWAQWATKMKERHAKLMKKQCPSGNCPAMKSDKPPLLIAKAPDLKSAEQYLTRAVSLAPDMAEAYFQLGQFYEAMGLKDQAIANYQKCLDHTAKARDKIKIQARIEAMQNGQDAAVQDSDSVEGP